jgi:hypothetical protein
LTHDALNDRYEQAQKTAEEPSGMDERLEIKGINFSGRESIFLADLIVFTQYPILGVGPGSAMEARAAIGCISISAHTEQSRMLSEHGLYGFMALLLLIINPIRAYNGAPNLETKVLVVCLTLFCFLSMMHVAMRLATPSFLYGLGFSVLVPALTNPLMRAEKK